MPTHPGNTIEGKTEYSEKTATWAVTITDLTTGKTSRLLNIKMIPNDSNTIEPVIALENYGASLICKNGKFNDEWPQSTIKFSNFNLQDSNKNNIIKKSHITADYNHHRFQNPDTNKLCERLDNPPTNDKQHYYIDTTTWPESITFQTSGTIKEVTEDL